jgi:two-component system, response regulator PdtaR
MLKICGDIPQVGRTYQPKAVIHMKSVLIADDEPVIRMSLKARLKELGFDEIMECGDGDTAVRTAISRIPDIVILDVSMPGRDGIAAAGEIRKKLKVPILLLTACYDHATVKRAAENGIAAFLTKPLRDQDLWPAIELAVAHASEVEELKEQVEDLKETIETRKVIERAKGVLMKTQGLSEPEAFRKMQKLAMDKRKSMRQVADAILLTEM